MMLALMLPAPIIMGGQLSLDLGLDLRSTLASRLALMPH